MSEFIQDGPQLGENQFQSDSLLLDFLSTNLPQEIRDSIYPGLVDLGRFVASDMMSFFEDSQRCPPELIPFDAWGNRVDQIRVSRGWTELQAVAAREGIVATAYERKEAEFSRLHQAVRLYLYHPSSAFFSCPLAMTDGAARCLELIGSQELRETVLNRLTSRNPEVMWTSGQWMTERPGGSDVGRSETVARKEGNGYRLFGTKWFTSATTSEMAMTLARIEGAPEGSRGLSLFYVPMANRDEFVKSARVLRLKDKLGTKALPTAEIQMNGVRAQLIGDEHKGVKNITSLLNVTRYYNAVCSIAAIRRLYSLAVDYSHRRVAFGKKLIDHPLHAETLARVQVDLSACLHLTLHASMLMGRDECGKASDEDTAILRLLIPLIKLYTGKKAVSCTSELLECFGGAGYIEDTGLPLFLRDAQVFPLWEGTTNVLSLDGLRAISRESALEPFLQITLKRCEAASHKFPQEAAKVSHAVQELGRLFDGSDHTNMARDIALALVETFAGGLLLQHGLSSELGEILARRFCSRPLFTVQRYTEDYFKTSKYLADPQSFENTKP